MAVRIVEETKTDEGQRARLRRLVAELTGGGQDLRGLPRHNTGLVDRLRELGRHDEAVRIENGAGFSLHAGEDAVVVWIISGGRRERLFDDVKRGDRAALGSGGQGRTPCGGRGEIRG